MGVCVGIRVRIHVIHLVIGVGQIICVVGVPHLETVVETVCVGFIFYVVLVYLTANLVLYILIIQFVVVVSKTMTIILFILIAVRVAVAAVV